MNLTVKAQYQTFNDEERIKYNVIGISPIDWGKECRCGTCSEESTSHCVRDWQRKPTCVVLLNQWSSSLLIADQCCKIWLSLNEAKLLNNRHQHQSRRNRSRKHLRGAEVLVVVLIARLAVVIAKQRAAEHVLSVAMKGALLGANASYSVQFIIHFTNASSTPSLLRMNRYIENRHWVRKCNSAAVHLTISVHC